MKTFREIAIQEALKIVKKNKPENIDISYFDDCEIIRTNHTKKVRDRESSSRDNGLRDAVILKAVKKAWKKGLKQKTKTMITYKNKYKKYDMMVVEWDKKKIILVTSIQHSKDLPKYYFGPSHKDDAKIMTEKK